MFVSSRFLFGTYAENVIYSAGCLALGLGGDVGVGVQGEAGAIVAQHAADCLDVHAVLEGKRGEGMAEIMKPHLGQPRPLQHPMEHVEDAVR